MSDTDDAAILPWQVSETVEVLNCPVFSVERRKMTEALAPGAETARSGLFYAIRPPDWVNVVAILEHDRVVLIEQWRHGVLHPTIEIPGGVIDPGESPETAAARELAEETGYTAHRWTYLGASEPNPAIQSNRCHTYLAEGCRPGPTRFDANERIRSFALPFEESLAWVKQGRITHALAIVGLTLARLHR
jgi:ADP-ribose pyrophosphatase